MFCVQRILQAILYDLDFVVERKRRQWRECSICWCVDGCARAKMRFLWTEYISCVDGIKGFKWPLVGIFVCYARPIKPLTLILSWFNRIDPMNGPGSKLVAKSGIGAEVISMRPYDNALFLTGSHWLQRVARSTLFSTQVLQHVFALGTQHIDGVLLLHPKHAHDADAKVSACLCALCALCGLPRYESHLLTHPPTHALMHRSLRHAHIQKANSCWLGDFGQDADWRQTTPLPGGSACERSLSRHDRVSMANRTSS